MRERAYEVLLGDDVVGVLAEDAEGRIGLRFSENYIRSNQRPVLSQSFEDDLERTYAGKGSGRLPTFFANLLPEGKLRAVLHDSLKIAEDDDLGLLAAVGFDLPGAVSLRALDSAPPGVDVPPQTEANGNGGDEAAGLRFSLAGIQMKFSMIQSGERFTLPAHDSRGQWIVKVGDLEYPGLSENEFAILSWAEIAGFIVPERRLLGREELPAIQKYMPKGSRALAVRRYDRLEVGAVHQEDFAQIIGTRKKYDGSYDQIGVIVRRLMGDAAYDEFIRRMALVIATGNNDAHLKNWSLVYPDRRSPQLAPLYDQVSTVAWSKLDRELALKFSGTRDFRRVTSDFFGRLAKKAGSASDHAVRTALTTIETLRNSWSAYSDILPRDHAAAIQAHWRQVPVLREVGSLD